MTRLAANFNLPDLAPDEQGTWHISFDDVHLAIGADAGTMTVHSTLGHVDPADEASADALLTGNFFGDGAGGAGLATDPYGTVTLHRRVLLEQLDYEELVTVLERFVNYAEYWQKRLDEAATAPPSGNTGAWSAREQAGADPSTPSGYFPGRDADLMRV